MTHTKRQADTSNGCFLGFPISEVGIKYGRVDYAALAEAVGDAVPAGELIEVTSAAGMPWDVVNGTEWNEELTDYKEFYQYFIISNAGARILEEFTNELVYYNSELELHVWAIDHCGTPWRDVLTDIPLDD